MVDDPTPNIDTPWLEGGKTGISRIWWRWLTSVIDALWATIEALPEATPAAGSSVTVGASPFSYEAASAGSLLVNGGTVSAITIERAAVVYATPGTAGFIPVRAGDIVEVTYTVLPTLTFLP